jgi:hypothetical protein
VPLCTNVFVMRLSVLEDVPAPSLGVSPAVLYVFGVAIGDWHALVQCGFGGRRASRGVIFFSRCLPARWFHTRYLTQYDLHGRPLDSKPLYEVWLLGVAEIQVKLMHPRHQDTKIPRRL